MRREPRPGRAGGSRARTVGRMPPATSDLAAELAPGLLDRFVRYARIDTQAGRSRTQSPSTPGQLELGRMLVEELREAGLDDAALDDNGYVTATLPGNRRRRTGRSAYRPRRHEPGRARRAGRADRAPRLRRRPDRAAAGRHRARPGRCASSRPSVGHDIVTSSGDTLLGADDKAGVAEIITAVAHLAAHPELPRPTLRDRLHARRGDRRGRVALRHRGLRRRVRLHAGRLEPRRAAGRDVHGRRGDDRASRASTSIPASPPASSCTPRAWPRASSRRCRPTGSRRRRRRAARASSTSSRSTATPARATLAFIVRDFDDGLLDEHVALLRHTAEEVMATEPRRELEFDARRQYPNMRTLPRPVPGGRRRRPSRRSAPRASSRSATRSAAAPTARCSARRACRRRTSSRAATSSTRVREWASVQDMAAAAAVVVHLARLWTEA